MAVARKQDCKPRAAVLQGLRAFGLKERFHEVAVYWGGCTGQRPNYRLVNQTQDGRGHASRGPRLAGAAVAKGVTLEWETRAGGFQASLRAVRLGVAPPTAWRADLVISHRGGCCPANPFCMCGGKHPTSFSP